MKPITQDKMRDRQRICGASNSQMAKRRGAPEILRKIAKTIYLKPRTVYTVPGFIFRIIFLQMGVTLRGCVAPFAGGAND
jgi:hypothetical protein